MWSHLSTITFIAFRFPSIKKFAKMMCRNQGITYNYFSLRIPRLDCSFSNFLFSAFVCWKQKININSTVVSIVSSVVEKVRRIRFASSVPLVHGWQGSTSGHSLLFTSTDSCIVSSMMRGSVVLCDHYIHAMLPARVLGKVKKNI